MVFAQPDNLYFFALFILFAGAWIAYAMWHRKVRHRAGDEPLIAAMTATVDHRGRLLRRIFQLTGMALIIFALAQPQWGMSDEEIQQEAIDIVFALDMSRSMLAEDIAPNRLTASNQEVLETMNRLSSDRVGLVIFTSLSFVQSPLTTDYAAIDFFMNRLHPDQIPVGGTNISAAMQDSIEVLRGRDFEEEGDSPMHRSENQVIVLLTDGEDHESSPIAAADQARQEGIRIVTIGVGSRDGAQIPAYDERGNRSGYVRDEQGERVITRLDEDTLREIAALTDGTYIHFEQAGQASNQLIAFLDELERTSFDEQITERHVDRFLWFLVPAFILLTMSLFIGRRLGTRSRWRRWLPFSLVILLIFITGCDPSLQRVDPDAERAAEAIILGQYDHALELLDNLDEEQRHRPETYFNRGRAHLGLQNYGAAREAFAAALNTTDAELSADAHYHMGLAFGAEEEWNEARQSFEDGLRYFATDEPPEDADLHWALKQSLEVALRELFPPCSTFEDEFEPNDTTSEATQLQEFFAEDLTLCGGNDDYFMLPVFPGTTIGVETTFRELRDEPDPEHVFLPEPSSLQLTLYGADGTSIIDIDQGEETEDDELRRQNERRRLTRRIDEFEISAEQLGSDSQAPVFIGLRARDGLEFAYELEIDVQPPCEALEDEFEPNSSADQAAALPLDQPSQLQICPDDEDWFRFDMDRGDSLFIDVQATADDHHETPPELQLELVREDTGQVIGVGQPDGGLLTAGITDVDFGSDVLLRVRGVDQEQQGPYSIQPHHFEPCDQLDEPSPIDLRARLNELGTEEVEHRYLRRCHDQPDFHLATHEEEDDDEFVDWTLRVLPEQAWQGDPDIEQNEAPFGPFPEMQLDLMAGFDGSVHASAIGPDEFDDPPADDQIYTSLTDDYFLFVQDPPRDGHSILRVDGDPGFYHLRRPDDEEDQDDDEQDEQDQDEQDQDDDDQDEQDDDDQDEQDQDEQDQDDDEQDEQDQDEQDQDDDEQDEQDQDEQDGADDEEQLEEEDMSADEIDAILRSLEESDQNFQLQRSVEDTPPRDVQHDW